MPGVTMRTRDRIARHVPLGHHQVIQYEVIAVHLVLQVEADVDTSNGQQQPGRASVVRRDGGELCDQRLPPREEMRMPRL